ncbi:MAG: radical SAM protein [Desulfotignum sp.]|nr:radical SAM protein [Desulfotignum sp.]
MAQVVLVQPPIEDYYLTRKRTLPYGLMSIAASLRACGFETAVIDGLATRKSRPMARPDLFAHMDAFYGRPDRSLFGLFHAYRHFGYTLDHIALEVVKHTPFLVGISSLFSAYHDIAMATAAAIRHWNPEAVIVMGGHHPTLFPEEVVASPDIDYVIRGEGEDTLPLLCRAIQENNSVAQVPGIAFQRPDQCQDPGHPVIQPPYWTPDLSRLPLPEPMDLPHYRRKHQDAIMVVSSRGCPMPCSYCAVSAASSHGRYRRRPVAHVLEEIRIQADGRDIGFIDFEDENISFDRTWFLALLDGITQIFAGRPPVELRAMNGLFPPSLDRDMIQAMAETGFKTLNLSVGSMSAAQLKRFQRPDVRAAHDRALDWAKEQGLACVSYLIAAAPGQHAFDSLADLLYLATRPTLAGLSIFYPAPGSRDYAVCRQMGILPAHSAQMRSTAFPLDHTTTRVQAVTLLRLCRVLNYLKHRVDVGLGLPDPRPAPKEKNPALDPGVDRDTASEKLLAWFLFDYRIRGVDQAGQVYVHQTDPDLCRVFADAVKTHAIAGVIPPCPGA